MTLPRLRTAGAALLRACAAVIALTSPWPVPGDAVAADAPPPTARVAAHSAELLAVGIVQDDHMSIHLSRTVDNAPVRDAVLTVLLRGVPHPTMAEADGSYTLRDRDLKLPGSAAVMFRVMRGGVPEDLQGTLEVAGTPEHPEDRNSARQLWWWVLNFAVCIGFLMLLSRRRKAAAAQD